MNHNPFEWGRPSDTQYGEYDSSISMASAKPIMKTQQPIIMGTSVISMKYNDGVVIAADSMGSYGSLLRFTDVNRLFIIGSSTVVGVSGDMSDMQYIEHLLEDLEIENSHDNPYADYEEALRPSYVFEYLASLMYQRRSKMNPLWNTIIVAGVEADKQFLKYVDLRGVRYSSSSIASGFGSDIAIPLIRRVVDSENDVSKVEKETAVNTVIECMKVLFYRDARSSKKFKLAIVDKHHGISMESHEVNSMNWEFAKDIKGYGTQKV